MIAERVRHRVAPAGPAPERHIRKPAFALPRGTCDTHAYVFGPAAEFSKRLQRGEVPSECTFEDLQRMHAILGVDRAVVMHGGPYGSDNSVTLHALARRPDALRGICVIQPGLPRRELEDLHRHGMRGCRISSGISGGAGFEHARRLADETAEFDWHLVVQVNRGTDLLEVAPLLEAARRPFVLNHLACISARDGMGSAAFRTMLRLLDTDRCWIKLSSLYRLSAEPYPHADLLPLIGRIVEERPDRILWGTNWPHPVCPVPMPNDGDLVDLIPLWLPDERSRHMALVENPAELYGF